MKLKILFLCTGNSWRKVLRVISKEIPLNHIPRAWQCTA
jgi:hypothetical protein